MIDLSPLLRDRKRAKRFGKWLERFAFGAVVRREWEGGNEESLTEAWLGLLAEWLPQSRLEWLRKRVGESP